MENHLIIGLGGTGGRVLAAFRKLMFERFDGDVKPKDMWIDYLYVDSSEQDLKMKDPAQWSVMGKSISLTEDSIVKIPAANLRDYVDNKSRFKYLVPWLGNSEDWKNIINDPKIGEGAAGQKRRLGRLLFANGSPEFNKVVGVKARNLSYNPDGRKITYHVVAGLAGGTGSGSIVDVVAQLRKQFPDQANNKIVLYLLLPEEHPNPEWASTNNYKPNGYVALTELNALDMKAFKPWNLSEREYDVKKLDLDLPFYSAYLITDTNRVDVRFDVNKVIPATIAELIYQKTVGVALSDRKIGEGATESAAHFFNNVEKGENPNYSDYDSPHCYKFNGFGIKRLAIPEQEIKEFFGYSFAYQAALKMLFNNLSRESGYVAEAPVNDDYAFVTLSEQKKKWCISRDNLCLSIPILSEHKKEGWRPIADEFGQVEKFCSEIINTDEIEHADKLIAIRNKTKRFFDKDFRPIAEAGQNGVVTFYEKKAKFGREAIVAGITEKINADLLQLWLNGDKSLYQLSGIVQTLLKYFEEEKAALVRLTATADDEIKRRDVQMKQLNESWCAMSTGRKLLSNIGLNNSKDELSSQFTKAVKEKYVLMTWKESYGFARILIDDLTNSVQVIKGDIERTITQMQNAQDILYGAINSRCQVESEEKQSLKGVVIKNYDANKVQSIIKGAIAYDTDNKDRIRLMMAGIQGLLNPERPNFREVADKLNTGTLISTFEKIGEEEATNFFSNEIGRDYIPGYEKLIGVNIIKKLYDEYSGNDEGLREKLNRLVRHAAITNKHRGIEVNNGPKVRSSMFVILPDYDDNPDFLQKIEDLIKSFTSEGNIKVSRGGNSNEIVVITLETNLTPRYLQNVYTLKEDYDRLMNSQQGRVARFETQLEDYAGIEPLNIEECKKMDVLPSLYLPTDEEKEHVNKLKQKIDNQSSNAGNPPIPPLPPMSPISEPQVSMYLHIGGQNYGPYDYKTCKSLVQNGQLTSQTLVWQEGMAAWQAAGEVAELKSLFVPIPDPNMPPVPPTPSSMPSMPPTL
ncbi:MAG: DUF4339 domain-containing protein [Prevotella sp.]|nr:DUF4339 domain-containing protein [Prevotella sp.]